MTDDIIKSLVLDFQSLPDAKQERDSGIEGIESADSAAFMDRVKLMNSVKLLQHALTVDASEIQQITQVAFGGSSYSLNDFKQVQSELTSSLTEAYLGVGPEYRMNITLDGETLATFDVITREKIDKATVIFTEVATEVAAMRDESDKRMTGYIQAAGEASPLVADHLVASGAEELPVQLANRARELLAEKFNAAEVASRSQS